jgi:transcription initiation factor TFIIH subunit 1
MAAVEWDSGEELIIELPYVRHSKKDGVLYVTNQRLAWAEYSAKEFKFQCGFPRIKSQRISPETSSKVQLQIVMFDGSTATFHFTNALSDGAALQDRNTVKDMLVKFIQQHKPKPNKELEEKTRLLNSDPALYQLYKDIVVSGILTAEEFWANRQEADETPKNEQKTGISPATMAELQPQVNGANAVKYTLTADIMRAIFKTYPAVEKIHAENVPDKMSEEDFWRQFFDSHYFHRDRMRATTTAKRKTDLISQSAEKDESEQLAESLKECINPLLDLRVESSESQTYEGYGTGLYSSKAPPTNSGPTSLIRRFNHQSMMILKSRINESNTETSNDVTEPPKRARLLRDAVEYTELENVTESHASNLTISNSEQYSHGPTALETNDKEETKLGDRQHAVERFRHSFSQWSSDLCHVSCWCW